MTALEVREKISDSYNYAIDNDFIDTVIRLYINNGEDITIWEDNIGFHFSSGACSYISLDELLDDLCEEIETKDFEVTDVEIE